MIHSVKQLCRKFSYGVWRPLRRGGSCRCSAAWRVPRWRRHGHGERRSAAATLQPPHNERPLPRNRGNADDPGAARRSAHAPWTPAAAVRTAAGRVSDAGRLPSAPDATRALPDATCPPPAMISMKRSVSDSDCEDAFTDDCRE